MTAVQQRLAGGGIAADALRTRGLDLRPEFDYANGKQALREYVAVNTLEVRVDAIDRARRADRPRGQRGRVAGWTT